jgi:hypothetical protein
MTLAEVPAYVRELYPYWHGVDFIHRRLEEARLEILRLCEERRNETQNQHANGS